ncbi:serine protease easter [Drosophila takahashii]|uniref:serine protease easter n=1 Tax=Drosophila takahashii TaxID=29030 RepID=UPI001CF8E600|nr:serine protease easter isoform X2 [Drosophila takahashii]
MSLLIASLLLALLGASGAQQLGKAIMHFGNCNSAEFGRGTCIEKKDCDFYAVDKLSDLASKQQCFSRQRPDLVCCPRETNIIPPFAPRIGNVTTSPSPSNRSTTLLKLLSSRRPSPPTGIDELPQHPYCGSAFAFRVFGGHETGLYEFPWTVLLEYEILADRTKDYACGASFIAQRWLVTAAHCIETHGRRLTAAILGEWDRDTDPDCVTYEGERDCAPPHTRVTFDRVLSHERYSNRTYVNDIALLRLSRPVNWLQVKNLEPVCLPPARGRNANQLAGSAADVSGWGKTESSASSRVKRKAMLTIQAQEQCQEAFAQDSSIVLTEGQMCAGGEIGVDSCAGDSGGPLTVEANTPEGSRHVYLAGIVSIGREHCGQKQISGIYTRVSGYMDWIESTIRANRV